MVELRGNDGRDRLGRLAGRLHRRHRRAVHVRLRETRYGRSHEPLVEARGLLGVRRGRERLHRLLRLLVVAAVPAEADDDDDDQDDDTPDRHEATAGDPPGHLVRDGVAAGRSRGVGVVGIVGIGGHRHLLIGLET